MDAYEIVDPSRRAVGQDLWDRSTMDRGAPEQTMTAQLTADREVPSSTAANTTPRGTINNRRFAAAIAGAKV